MRKIERDFASVASCADPRIRFKHETLMDGFQELAKENEITRRNLETMKQIRSILRAEVRFLKRRYKHLTQDQGLETPQEMMRFPDSGDFRVSRKVNSKRKMQTGLKFSGKSTMSNEKEAMGNLTGGLSKKQKRNKENNENEVYRIPMSLPDLNQTEKTCKIDENTSGSSKVPVFDLNEISREEVESQAIGEDMDNMVVGLGSEELQGEIKLPIYRNVKKGLNRGVKRKVTWQDPVALRV